MEGLQFIAAGDILARFGEKQDVRESRGRRGCAQEDEPGRNALGSAALDDAGMLGKVADEHADQDEAASV